MAIDFSELKKALPSFPFLYGGGLGDIIWTALQYILVIAGLMLLLYLIFGGFQLMTSSGDPAKIKEARAVITQAIVGFLIIFVAYWIIQAVGVIFGISEIQNIFQSSPPGGPPAD